MNEEKRQDDWTAAMVREHFNPPPPTPRDEIWAVLEERLEASRKGGGLPSGKSGAGEAPISLAAARASRTGHPAAGWRGLQKGTWLAAAAAVVLSLGIGLGRWSRTPGPTDAAVDAPATRGAATRRAVTASRVVAMEHLARAEPLVSLVKADVARGSVDPAVAEWAQGLLDQTRFLLDSGLPLGPDVVGLLEDLELVLVQTTLVAGGGMDEGRAREELELLGEGMEDRNVLPRIQAMAPAPGAALAGS